MQILGTQQARAVLTAMAALSPVGGRLRAHFPVSFGQSIAVGDLGGHGVKVARYDRQFQPLAVESWPHRDAFAQAYGGEPKPTTEILLRALEELRHAGNATASAALAAFYAAESEARA